MHWIPIPIIDCILSQSLEGPQNAPLRCMYVFVIKQISDFCCGFLEELEITRSVTRLETCPSRVTEAQVLRETADPRVATQQLHGSPKHRRQTTLHLTEPHQLPTPITGWGDQPDHSAYRARPPAQRHCPFTTSPATLQSDRPHAASDWTPRSWDTSKCDAQDAFLPPGQSQPSI